GPRPRERRVPDALVRPLRELPRSTGGRPGRRSGSLGIMSRTSTPPPDTRIALQLPASENADLCSGCTRCCETVSIEVDTPRSPWEYDQWIWVLHHQNLEVYVERPERWFLHIET